MNRLFISIVVVFAILAGLLTFQATRKGTSVVYLPSDLLAKGPSASLTRIRVGGKVAALPIEYKVQPEIELKFSIQNPGKSTAQELPTGVIPVVSHDLKPDMFAAGRDIIIDGDYSNGVLTATHLLTQCPSKYEPPSPEKQYKLSQESTKE